MRNPAWAGDPIVSEALKNSLPHLEIHDAGDIDVTLIPPRGWLLGVSFCRKFISGIIGEGGVGKTAVRYAQFLAGATGRRDITDEFVHHRFRTLIVCLEDDLDEVKRRLGAAMLHHAIAPADVKGWLTFATPRGLKLLVENGGGPRETGQLYYELREAIAVHSIDLVALDPFIKAHGVNENDNNAVDEVCIQLAALADEFNVAIDLASHQRKGGTSPGDADRDRGASAKKDASRLMRTLTPMSPDDASALGVNEDMRTSLVRLDDAKINIARESPDATWFRLVSVPLGNGNPAYPNGDDVQTVERWHPPGNSIDKKTANDILDAIHEGPAPGHHYSDAPRCDQPAWRVVLKFKSDWTKKQCTQLVADWLRNGTLRRGDYQHPEQRRNRKGLFVGTRPGSYFGDC